MIRFSCLGCGKTYSVNDKLGGRTAKCKACGNKMVIPTGKEASRQSSGNVIRIPSQGSKPTSPGVDAAVKTATEKIKVSFVQSPRQEPQPTAVLPEKNKFAGRSTSSTESSRRGSMRVRRLRADEADMRKAFSRFLLIRLLKADGKPAELYQLEYQVKGLARGNNGKPVERKRHLVEIQLTREYPRQSPKCKMLTPIFHPNIDLTAICVGDHWTAQESLVDLVVRIGEIITFQAFNIKSPLDGEAAMWADLNRDRFPLDRRDLTPPEHFK